MSQLESDESLEAVLISEAQRLDTEDTEPKEPIEDEIEVDVEAIPEESKSSEVNGSTAPSPIESHEVSAQLTTKEKFRRKRVRSSIDDLKILVPGLVLESSEIQTFDMAVKYVRFLKTFVTDTKLDKDFVMSQVM